MNQLPQLQHIDFFHKANYNKEKSPVLVKFNSVIAKNLVIKTKNLLKWSKHLQNITIKEDFLPAIRRIREQQIIYLLETKKNNYKSIINGQIFSLEELHTQDILSVKKKRSKEK